MEGMVLAGDLGGTKTLLGLFARDRERPRPTIVREYATLDFDSLADIATAFFDDTGAAEPEAVCIGVAGAVTGDVARLVNVPWMADVSPLAARCSTGEVRLVNDLEALAFAVPVLDPEELAVLQGGVPDPTGNAAVIAAGTGLGEAFLHNVGGGFVPAASEGGHADFAARTPRERALLEALVRTYGRVDNERVISGPGLVNLFHFTHGDRDPLRACTSIGPDVEPSELPARISDAALSGACERCVEALTMFVEAYGAEAGNLALRSVATAGVYVGGGIAPKILPALERGAFMEAFRDKPPMTDLLRTLPVSVILNPSAGLLGAAVHASTLGRETSRGERVRPTGA